jgi:hypothetical protein
MKLLALITGFIYLFWLYYKHIVVYIQEEMKQAKKEMLSFKTLTPENNTKIEPQKSNITKKKKVLIEKRILEEIKKYENQPSRVWN